MSRHGYPVAIDGFQITGGAQSDFPGQHQRAHRRRQDAVRRGRCARHPGRRHLRPQQRPRTCRSPTTSSRQQRLATAAASASAPRTPVTTATTTPSSPDNQIRDNGGTNLAGGIGLFTGSDGYKVDSTTRSAATSPRSTAARSTAFGYQANRAAPAPAGRSRATASGSTAPTTRAARSWSPASCRPTPTQLSPGHRAGDHRRQRHPGQPRQRRRRRHPAAAGRAGRTSPRPTRRRSRSPTTPSPTTSRPTRVAASPSTTRRSSTSSTTRSPSNLTTATAVTSDGHARTGRACRPRPNSDPLQARLSDGSRVHRQRDAGQATVQQADAAQQRVLGQPGRHLQSAATSTASAARCPTAPPTTTNNWDMGVMDGPGVLHPVGSVLQTTTGTDGGAS